MVLDYLHDLLRCDLGPTRAVSHDLSASHAFVIIETHFVQVIGEVKVLHVS